MQVLNKKKIKAQIKIKYLVLNSYSYQLKSLDKCPYHIAEDLIGLPHNNFFSYGRYKAAKEAKREIL